MKTKTTLSQEGIYFLFVVIVFMIGSIVREVNPMLLLATALFAIIPTAGWIGRQSLHGIRVKRKLPERVFAGEPFVIHVELSKYNNNYRYNNSNPKSQTTESDSESKEKSESELDSKQKSNFDSTSESSAQSTTKNITNLTRKKNSSNNKSKKIKHKTTKNIGSWGIVVSDKIQLINNDPDNETSSDIQPYEPAVYFEFVETNGVVRKTYAGKLPQRGQYKFDCLTVSTRFPYGFFRHSICQTNDNNSDELCVFPKIGRLSSKWRTRRAEAAINRQRYRFRPSRGTGEFLGVRRWLSGDTKKWIHWRASAKHGQPFVRQFETKQNHDCAVLLDLYDENFLPNQNASDNFELAVSFAATLVSEMTRRGGCDLFFATSKPNEENLSGPICLPLVESVLRRLATTKQESKDNLPRVIIESITQIDPGADIILISPKPLNLINSPRFNPVRNDPKFRTAIQRIKIVDTSNQDFDQYFSLQ
ncbi:MAG: DUF58 domain-containing protein [Planctomycetaceae bacterium]|jgi:uncharacterized protein (DUF58 family)|nr:DUF58 domain-containing protein [Planctomycetaceae bacterium]